MSQPNLFDDNAAAPAAVAATPNLFDDHPVVADGGAMRAQAVQAAFSANPLANAAQPALDLLLNGGGPAAGQLIGANTGPMAPVAVPVLGGLGGLTGNALSQGIKMATGEQPDFKWGEFWGSGAAGMVPGGPEAKAGVAGVKQLVKEGVKLAGSNVAAGEVRSLIDEGKPLSGTQAAIQAGIGLAGAGAQKALGGSTLRESALPEGWTPTKLATLREGQAANYAVPPTETNPTLMNKTLSSAAGAQDLKKMFTVHNQQGTNSLAAQAIGLDPAQDITLSSIKAARTAAEAPYRELSSLDANAAENVENLKQAWHDTNDLWKKYGRTKDPVDKKAAVAAGETADKLQSQLEDYATELYGRKDLTAAMVQAKKKVAQTYVVENNLNPATGNVSAPGIGRLYAKNPVLLSDGLDTIGRFQQAFPRFMGEPESMTAAGVHKLSMFTGAAAGAAAGGHYFGPGGAVAGGLAGAMLPAAQSHIPAMLMSPAYQARFAQPITSRVSPDMAALLARFSTVQGGNAVDPQFLQSAAQSQ